MYLSGIIVIILSIMNITNCSVPRPQTNELEPTEKDSTDSANLDELVCICIFLFTVTVKLNRFYDCSQPK